MSTKLNCAVLAATLSALVLAVPASAADWEVGQTDSVTHTNVIRADGWQDTPRARDNRTDGFRADDHGLEIQPPTQTTE